MTERLTSRTRPRLGAATQIRVLLAVLVAIFVLGSGSTAVLLASSLDAPTKLGAIADVLAAGAFVFALLAAVVGTMAYRVAILKPDLRAEVTFGHGVNDLELFVEPPNDKSGNRAMWPTMQTHVQIHLHNHGAVSARNPALRFRLVGMMFPPRQQEGWAFGGHFHGLGGFEWAQWDGGADFSIHPNWGRDLPMLLLDNVVIFARPEPGMWLEVVADGFSDGYPLPIKVVERTMGS